jgi:hypothetical protein
VIEPRRLQAIAIDGPAQSDQTLRVDDHDAEGRWPSPITWGPPDDRHVYVLDHIALTPSGVPAYRHERKLEADEESPPEGRAKPPK